MLTALNFSSGGTLGINAIAMQPCTMTYYGADQTQFVNDNFKLPREGEEEEEQLNLVESAFAAAAAANSSIREMPKRHDSGRTKERTGVRARDGTGRRGHHLPKVQLIY